ncbi:MAG TPA: PspC domain-containing protein [Propionibacteriaceae bacterium]|nr:PspC domain-containing protein [Propionibacteriaceae bacterium]
MARHDLIDTAAQAMVSLRREPQGARLAGVCQGLALRTGIDVRLIRVATVVLALSGGLGVALYASGWLLLPTAGRADLPLARVLPPAQNWDGHTRLAITAVITAAVWLVAGSSTPFGLAPALVIAALIVVNQRRRARTHAAPAPAAPTAPEGSTFTSAVSAWQQRLDHVADSGDGTASPPAPPPPIARTSTLDAELRVPRAVDAEPDPGLPAPPRRSRLVPLLILVLALVVGVGSRSLPTGLDPRHQVMVALALSLAVLGAGLVLAGLAGYRARLVMPVGVALCVALAALQTGLVNSQLVWAPSQSGAGSAQSPLTFSGVQQRVSVLPQQAGSTIHVEAKASDITIVVPDSMTAVVDYSIRYSDLMVADRRVAGFGTGALTLPAAQAASLPLDPGSTVTLVVSATMSRMVILHD